MTETLNKIKNLENPVLFWMAAAAALALILWFVWEICKGQASKKVKEFRSRIFTYYPDKADVQGERFVEWGEYRQWVIMKRGNHFVRITSRGMRFVEKPWGPVKTRVVSKAARPQDPKIIEVEIVPPGQPLPRTRKLP